MDKNKLLDIKPSDIEIVRCYLLQFILKNKVYYYKDDRVNRLSSSDLNQMYDFYDIDKSIFNKYADGYIPDDVYTESVYNIINNAFNHFEYKNKLIPQIDFDIIEIKDNKYVFDVDIDFTFTRGSYVTKHLNINLFNVSFLDYDTDNIFPKDIVTKYKNIINIEGAFYVGVLKQLKSNKSFLLNINRNINNEIKIILDDMRDMESLAIIKYSDIDIKHIYDKMNELNINRFEYNNIIHNLITKESLNNYIKEHKDNAKNNDMKNINEIYDTYPFIYSNLSGIYPYGTDNIV